MIRLSPALPLFLVALGACGPKAPATSATPATIELTCPSDATGVQPVIATAAAGADRNLEGAIDMLEQAYGSHTGTARSCVALYLGEDYRIAGQEKAAAARFQEVTSSLQGNLATSARLGQLLLAAPVEVMADPAALEKALLTFDGYSVLHTQEAERQALLAHLARIRGDGAAQAARASQAKAIASTSYLATRRAQQWLKADLPTPVQPDTGPPADTAAPAGAGPLDDARAALGAGRNDEALQLIDRVPKKQLTDAVVAEQQYLRSLAHGATLDTGRIGVLLPLSGRFASVGRQVREALEVGWAQGGASQQLVFVDSGGTDDAAMLAFDELVRDEGVLAVIGPLLSAEVEGVVDRADAAGVPLISLSQALDDAGKHPWVVQSWLTPRQQIEALLDSRVAAGDDAFAVFAPDSAYGEEAATLFAEEAAERGVTVTVSELYDAQATDYMPYAQKLGRKDYDARASEFASLRRRAREAGRDSSKVVLPPVIDFDAIFLPESASRLPLVAAALAYEEFPIGTFRTSKGGDTVPLLGLSSWNNTHLIAAGGSYTRTGVFTDVFIPPPTDAYDWDPAEGWQEFVDDYRDATTRTPTPIEALAVDAGLWVSEAAASSPRTRAAMLTALANHVPEGSVTGVTGYDDERDELTRRVGLFLVEKDGFLRVETTE